MKIQTKDGETYIVKREKFYKHTIWFSIFCGIYATWCFYQLISNISEIAFNTGGFVNVFGGSIHVVLLFLCATWIDEVLNDV